MQLFGATGSTRGSYQVSSSDTLYICMCVIYSSHHYFCLSLFSVGGMHSDPGHHMPHFRDDFVLLGPGI
jgi:hypothetical protein